MLTLFTSCYSTVIIVRLKRGENIWYSVNCLAVATSQAGTEPMDEFSC
jgi:hypothetical protein